MLVTRQPVLKRFWYPVIPIAQLSFERPVAFELLGQSLVLWLDADGNPVALADRCCHRSAQLSIGQVIDGCIRCPYHGWSYNGMGACVSVPQITSAIPASYRVPAYRCAARYGYAWVCLDEQPLQPIPDIPEAADPAHRLIPQFYERWSCAGLRLMENSFDNAHFSFVHAASFGDQQQPEPASLALTPLETGFRVNTTVEVVNPPLQQQNLQLATAKTVRTIESTWYLPFIRTLRIVYPNGVMHLLFTAATPIDDATSQIVQFCIRNDSEAEAKAADLIAFDRQVTQEDRLVLESTDYDVPLELRDEQHMASDQPGIIMRHRLAALLKQHGEVEQRRS